MKGIDEILKGIQGFISFWNGLSDLDDIRQFAWRHTPFDITSGRVQEALKNHIPLQRRVFKYGFWQKSCLVTSSENMFLHNGEIHEEHGQEEPYIGHVCDCPQPSSCIGVDCHEGYFVLIWLGDEDENLNQCGLQKLSLSLIS